MFWRKKDPNAIEYGNIKQRSFAILIDLFILLLLWVPIKNMILALIFHGGISPAQELSMIMQHNFEKSNPDLDFLGKLSIYKNSVNELSQHRGLIGLYIEQATDLFAISIYSFIFWLKYQATPGKMLLSLKIMDARTMEKPTFIQYLTRIFGYALSCIPLGLGVIWILLNKKKQAWHDMLAGTVVVKVKKDAK